MYAQPNDSVLGDAHHPHQTLLDDLDLMVRAQFPLLYLVTAEEDPVDEVLVQLANLGNPPRQLFFWDIVRGWHDNGSGKGSAMSALGRVGKESLNHSSLFVIRDLHPIFKTPETERHAPVIREIKNLTKELKRSRKTLIFTSHTLAVPAELLKF